jgi:D-alanyl-lipoteichoic acid acyltransferase DltB (MBOAT superfamily)
LLPWIPFVFPIVFLVLVKYFSILGWAIGNKTGAELFIGISYMAFRLSYLTLECRWEAVETPGFWDYMGFAFFLPTLSVGPISTYRLHSESLMRAEPVPYTEALLRILKGLVKYVFLSNIFNQFSYASLLLDGRPHSGIDLVVAAFSFYIYLYLNFSGYCDMAIGTAKLLGIRVAENFDNPFRARNVKDFWNRWHITLSTYVRDVVFSPLSKALTFRWGIKNTNHAVAVAILVVFVVVGIWHGVGLNYLAFGLVQGLGVIANHYYAIFLKRRLGKERFIAYSKNRTIEALSVCMTFTYTAASLFFFANDFRTAKRIVELVR